MRTCAREFRRGRPSAHYKAARNGPAPEKERHFRAFSLPRSEPFPSPVFRSVRPRSDRCLDRASDSGPFPACMPPDPDSVWRHPTGDRSRFPAVRLLPRLFRDARSAVARPRIQRPIRSNPSPYRRGSMVIYLRDSKSPNRSDSPSPRTRSLLGSCRIGRLLSQLRTPLSLS